MLSMTQIMRQLNNWFSDTAEYDTFKIESGAITVHSHFYAGQYIRIWGSRMNDAVYEVKSAEETPEGYEIPLGGDAKDETFTGAVFGLAVPPDFVDLVTRIQAFDEKQSGRDPTVSSESYRGTQRTWNTGSNGVRAGWQSVFADELAPYRKMFDDTPYSQGLTPDLLFERDLD